MTPRTRHRPRALAGLLLLAALAASPVLPAATADPPAARAGDLRFPPLPAVDVPRPERVVLDNGLVVLLLEDRELPLVEVTALVRGGRRLDPAAQVGLSGLGAAVLRTGGTAAIHGMPGDQLDDWLESHAAVLEVTAEEARTRATLSALAEDFPAALGVFADVLRRPAFDPVKLEVARNQAVARVARQNDEADDILLRELRKLVYGADSPLARSETFATLGAVRRDDLVAWHRRAFHPERTVLGLVGDFRAADAVALVRQAFGDWARGAGGPGGGGAGDADPEPAWRRQPNPGVFWAEKSDMTQSAVIMGHLGVRKDDPDFYALEVLNQVLSGSFASRLVAHVRTQKGLAYAVSGRVGSDWDHPGLTYLYMTTKLATTGAGIQALLDEARGLAAQPPTAEEVERARQALLNSFVFNVDSRRKVLAQVLDLELYGYPLDRLSRYRAGVEAVTVEQVRAAARHLRPADFALLVVGPAAGRDRPLTDFGKVTPVDLTIPGAAPQGK